jgi:hypothetical protein
MIKPKEKEIGRGSWHMWWRREMLAGFWWGHLNKRDHLGNLSTD